MIRSAWGVTWGIDLDSEYRTDDESCCFSGTGLGLTDDVSVFIISMKGGVIDSISANLLLKT